MPKPLPTTDFYAHHSPFGAFASFTLGRHGFRGGFGSELAGPADQDVYIAVVRPGKGVEALPFFRPSSSPSIAYTGEVAPSDSARSAHWRTFGPEEIVRTLGWATDSWAAGSLTFTLHTPFGPVPDVVEIGDGEMRRHLCPAIFAELTVDNRDGDGEAFGFFGIGAADPLRPLSDAGNGLLGMARGGEYGFAAAPLPGRALRELQTWELETAVALADSDAAPPIERLANRGGLLMTVPAGEIRTCRLALGFFRHGIVTSGIATTYLYSRLFSDLDTALAFAVENIDEYIDTARLCDEELDATGLSDERKFLVAHSTHSYLGSTMLLHDERGALPRSPFATTVHRPIWVVNEGEYRMLNTLDLTVDQAFFELLYHPWTLRNTLDLLIHRYSYTDEVQDATDPARPRFPGGISFTHDMGVANQFAPARFSAYERPDLSGCFSYMTYEQLCNFCLCAALYGLPTVLAEGDVFWLAAHRNTLHACLRSLLHRDGPDALRNGLMSFDSGRCRNGQEITTYDSLDPSLGQARGSAYLAVKTWAAYLALSRCFDTLGEEPSAVEAEERAACAAATIAAQWREVDEFFPALFEKDSPGGAARTLPVVESLVYPYLWGDEDAVSPYGRYGQLISQLRRHMKAALTPGICIDRVSGGLKITSVSENTWLSKLFLIQFVAETILGLKVPPSTDQAHARWLREGEARNHAFTDQVRSTDGADLGSRFYPRGVTSHLWMI
ncbi:MAG: glycoside hydrolase family 52 protein [Capsulimonadales bacterium]|nr:glycoside hydrolase family 52 protein [Capsulimonadales bacterium]